MIGSSQHGPNQMLDALLTSADQAPLACEEAQSASAVLQTITRSVSGIDDRNLVIASVSKEQAKVARKVERNLVRIHDL
ncbi:MULTISPECIES: hypothetical protein [unclassified Pseudomonas]|uniref:hypothetical protein n=1 Tax=unclassified Pseudomonas TaxID=196821 RepID=UPI001F3FC92B|nr:MULTISPECIES: hypothetical protein [unclassified Pseudomonas]